VNYDACSIWGHNFVKGDAVCLRCADIYRDCGADEKPWEAKWCGGDGRAEPAPWTPKVGEWVWGDKGCGPGRPYLVAKERLDKDWIEIEQEGGFETWIVRGEQIGKYLRPLRLSEVKTKDQAEQFMGRKGKYRNSTGELPGRFEIVGFVESRKGSNPWKLHWHDHGLGIADPIGCSGVSEDMTLFAEEE